MAQIQRRAQRAGIYVLGVSGELAQQQLINSDEETVNCLVNSPGAMCVALTATARVVFLFSSQLNAKFGDQLIHIKSANLDTWPRPRVLYLDELSSVNQTNTSSFCIRQLKASESRNLLIAALINWIGGFSRSEAPAGMFLNCLFLPFFFFCPLHTSARAGFASADCLPMTPTQTSAHHI